MPYLLPLRYALLSPLALSIIAFDAITPYAITPPHFRHFADIFAIRHYYAISIH